MVYDPLGEIQIPPLPGTRVRILAPLVIAAVNT